ncbi:MAG: hypothetical protein LBU57_04975 [Dysgonamonadaceae bacterium]|jgi:hypothetical protein|nr:hypothetical protein [Dysgonamonadaceae bacterium]
MRKTIHEKLIDSIKLHTPEGENTVDFLIGIIPLSKEAAYRRLRGDIQFTLAEAVRISERLNLSLDKIAEIDKKDSYSFHIKQFFTDKPFDKYYSLLYWVQSLYDHIEEIPDTMSYYAGNSLLPPFYFKYKAISKYAFFKWFYQISYTYGTAKRLQDVYIPDKIFEIQQELYEKSLQVPTCYIMGGEMISALVNDISYFTAIDLVTPNEVSELKRDISLMLNDIESITKNNYFPKTGKKALVYISDSYFDGNYNYISGTQFQICRIYLYGINQMICIDPVICENQKLWIESLISHSTLISGSGKLHASVFFNQQRELLLKI